jgi:phytoene dehydrogenase-like protein
VVGGGHNGLVAAAYLARNGLDTVVCERRDVPGGAAVSEHPFGPGYTVTSLSYVVSLLSPDLVRDLRLEQHGYHVYPQGPYFAPRADGRYLRLPDDPAARHAEIAKYSAADADAYDGYEAHLRRIGRLLGPLLHQIPPHLGSRRPADLWAQARLLAQLRGIGERGSVDVTRLLTGSIADLLDRYFESDAVRGVLSVSGVIGTWAGPRSAGTAYVSTAWSAGTSSTASYPWARCSMPGPRPATRTCARRSVGCTRPARPLTVAAASPAFRAATSSARSSPTAGRSGGRNAAPAGAAPSPVRPEVRPEGKSRGISKL